MLRRKGVNQSRKESSLDLKFSNIMKKTGNYLIYFNGGFRLSDIKTNISTAEKLGVHQHLVPYSDRLLKKLGWSKPYI